MSIDPTQTVGSLVTERPSRSVVLERFGLDYCCGGLRPLGEACETAGIGLDEVTGALEAHDASRDEEQPEWADLGLTALADHIEATHHPYVREALGHLRPLLEKVVSVHGERHPEIPAMAPSFRALSAEMEPHLQREEQVLFPMIRELDATPATTAPSFHCGSLSNPIRVMMMEHDQVGDQLAKINALTDGYKLPDDACNSFRALYVGLADLEADLHLHIHKENNVLFPAVVEAEESRQANA